MIVLVHENHDKWPNVTAVQHFCIGFDPANLVSFFPWFQLFTKNLFKQDSVMCIFFESEHLEHFI